jgi:hypothetical protein
MKITVFPLADISSKPDSSLILKMHGKNPQNTKTRVYSWKAFLERKEVEKIRV